MTYIFGTTAKTARSYYTEKSSTMDADDDDLLFDRRSYTQNHNRRRDGVSQSSSTTISTFDSVLTVIDSLTNPNFVILFTICLVSFYQFRG